MASKTHVGTCLKHSLNQLRFRESFKYVPTWNAWYFMTSRDSDHVISEVTPNRTGVTGRSARDGITVQFSFE